MTDEKKETPIIEKESKNQIKPGDSLSDAGAKSKEKPKSEVPDWAQELLGKVNKLEAENEALKEIAGKNAFRSLEISKKDHTQKIAHFKRMNDKIIIGWGKLDDSKFVPNIKDASKENLFINVKYIDKTEEKIPYYQFTKCNDLVYADLLEFRPMGDSLCKFEDGQKIKVSFKYLNA